MANEYLGEHWRRWRPRAHYRLGDVIVVRYWGRRQEYLLVGFEPYVRHDGKRIRRTQLAVWQSDCARCGIVFECRAPATAEPRIRRCPTHRRKRA